ncbi:hypothetical protein [Burkholderia multivorans]|uniref:hypothetical protein n=1 Tax=Burkholderia multivorans TaxID=87883 RepID=UPI0015E3089D|nr:hypothetical protein [Burkholderia multivorans]
MVDGLNASNNASSILAAESGEDKKASAYLDSIDKNQKENRDEWPAEGNAWTQKWQKGFIAKNGPDAIIRYDIAWEWVDNCRAASNRNSASVPKGQRSVPLRTVVLF